MQTVFAVALLASVASVPAFVPSSSIRAPTHLSERINNKIDLESPKVATMETLPAGGKKVYCRCWKSATFPLCNGAHVKHNEEVGDNVGPLIVSVEK
ncbi:CDGSH iron sulfur domain-containing protein [Tribonema minus]|uniref:CDGSH iron sulfur domain-containing protein n=1 Tax=Tribonema minus TaxID=303371 RepID=A0A835ZBW8_9STRA|nr:CDGSH iron sulfur domain-containing protein [Tribonema minus]